MSKSLERIENEIRIVPLLKRLEHSKVMLGKMCSEGRPPRMSIPPCSIDEDFFISITLQDAIDALKD